MQPAVVRASGSSAGVREVHELCGGHSDRCELVERLSFHFPVRPQVLLFTLGELLKAFNGSVTLGYFQA